MPKRLTTMIKPRFETISRIRNVRYVENTKNIPTRVKFMVSSFKQLYHNKIILDMSKPKFLWRVGNNALFKLTAARNKRKFEYFA
jgi:hypothetical protein